MLSGRRILVGVSGGIAAYKAAELVRALKKRGARVGLHCCSDGDWGALMGLGLGAQGLVEGLADAEAVPQRQGHMRGPGPASAAQLHVLQGGGASGLHQLLAGDPRDGGAEALQGLCLQLVGAAKVVQDPGLSAARVGVPVVLGELVIGDGGAVFVLASGGAEVHAYWYRRGLWDCDRWWAYLTFS